MKKKLLLIISALSLSALLLAGCGSGNANTQTPPDNQSGSSNSEGQTGEDAQGSELASIADMLGKSDADVAELYNGGAENKADGTSDILGRTYSTTIDGNAATLETVYSDDQTVVSISVSFTDKSADEVKTLMTDAFGEAEATDETDSMDSKYLTWNTDNAVIVMNESYDMAIVEFTSANA